MKPITKETLIRALNRMGFGATPGSLHIHQEPLGPGLPIGFRIYRDVDVSLEHCVDFLVFHGTPATLVARFQYATARGNLISEEITTGAAESGQVAEFLGVVAERMDSYGYSRAPNEEQPKEDVLLGRYLEVLTLRFPQVPAPDRYDRNIVDGIAMAEWVPKRSLDSFLLEVSENRLAFFRQKREAYGGPVNTTEYLILDGGELLDAHGAAAAAIIGQVLDVYWNGGGDPFPDMPPPVRKSKPDPVYVPPVVGQPKGGDPDRVIIPGALKRGMPEVDFGPLAPSTEDTVNAMRQPRAPVDPNKPGATPENAIDLGDD